jgi:hypothetical protein
VRVAVLVRHDRDRTRHWRMDLSRFRFDSNRRGPAAPAGREVLQGSAARGDPP